MAEEFSKKFPDLAIPTELVELRNAMAHGLIVEINHSGVDELIKFRKNKDDALVVEFSMKLERKRIQKIRQSLMELRRYITIEAGDKPKS